jgi:methyl coenzyme M reductase alpha subunit
MHQKDDDMAHRRRTGPAKAGERGTRQRAAAAAAGDAAAKAGPDGESGQRGWILESYRKKPKQTLRGIFHEDR